MDSARPLLLQRHRRKLTPLSVFGRALSFGLGFALVMLAGPSEGAILPEDRSDVMFHGYDGGGLQVSGPSVLVRKAYKDKFSAWGNYYVDMISSASIDVVTTASPYTEERKEYSLGLDYLHGKTSMGLAFTNSEESDYSADAISFGISHDFFGDLTNIGITYGRGSDEVRRNGDDVFLDEAKRQSYRVDLSQIITKNFLVNLNYEGVTDEGFLNNPYRQVRYQSASARGYDFEQERYPRTRTSSAVAIRGMYYLPYRASVKAEYRHYTDTWGIGGWNAELAYVHPMGDKLTFEGKYRFYTQSKADFYEDLFPYSNSQNFMARDKELATYQTHTVGAGVTYEFNVPWVGFLKRGEMSLLVDYMMFDYQDFRDLRFTDVAVGEEPAYNFDAIVVRAFISFFY